MKYSKFILVILGVSILFQNCSDSSINFKTLDYNSLSSSSTLPTNNSSGNHQQDSNNQSSNPNSGDGNFPNPAGVTPPVNTVPSSSSEFKFLSFLGDGLIKGIGDLDLVEESKNYSNTFFIKDDNLEKIVEKVRRVSFLKKKAIIMLEDIIFDWKSGRPAQTQINYTDNIEKLFNLISANGLLDTVLGFYVIDEPYWKNMNVTNKLAPQIVYQNLKNVGLSIKNIFKNKKLLIAEGYPVLDDFFKNGNWPGFPSEYDYIGLDCYVSFSGVCDTESSYRKYIQGIYSKLDKSNGQKMFLILDNYWGAPLGDQKKQIQDRLIERIKLQFRIANEYDVVGLVSFLYQTINESLVGLNDMIYLKSVTTKLSANYLQYPFCQSGAGTLFNPENCILNLSIFTTCNPSNGNSGDSVVCNANIKLNSTASSAYKQIEWEVEYDNHRIEAAPSCNNKNTCSWSQVPAGTYIVRAKVISLTGLMSWSDAVVTINAKKSPVIVTTTCSPSSPKSGDTVICTSVTSSDLFKNISWEVQYDNGKIESTDSCANLKACSWKNVPSGKYIVRSKIKNISDELSWSDAIVDVK